MGIPKEICEIGDELKVIYHNNDSKCMWVFNSRLDRNNCRRQYNEYD